MVVTVAKFLKWSIEYRLPFGSLSVLLYIYIYIFNFSSAPALGVNQNRVYIKHEQLCSKLSYIKHNISIF